MCLCVLFLVPKALVDLHIKLLKKIYRPMRKDKWESLMLKFCKMYSIPEFWELEHYGYKRISVQLKLRMLKVMKLFHYK